MYKNKESRLSSTLEIKHLINIKSDQGVLLWVRINILYEGTLLFRSITQKKNPERSYTHKLFHIAYKYIQRSATKSGIDFHEFSFGGGGRGVIAQLLWPDSLSLNPSFASSIFAFHRLPQLSRSSFLSLSPPSLLTPHPLSSPSLSFVVNASFSSPFFTLDHLLIRLVAIITVPNFCATSLIISLWNIHAVRWNHRLLVNAISPVSPLAQSPISSLVRTRSLQHYLLVLSSSWPISFSRLPQRLFQRINISDVMYFSRSRIRLRVTISQRNNKIYNKMWSFFIYKRIKFLSFQAHI